MTEEDFASTLYEIGGVKFGSFLLKSGILSPIYIDLRSLVSYPAVLREIGRLLKRRAADLAFDRIAGIPYTGLPIALALSLEANLPLIYPRREIKDYGTMRAIEGEYQAGEKALVVDDVISDGESKIQTIRTLEAAGLVVEDVLVLIDREQGGGQRLASEGYRLHSVLGLKKMLSILRGRRCISQEQEEEVLAFLAAR